MRVIFDSVIFGLQRRGGASNYWLEFMKRFPQEHDCCFYVLEDKEYKNKFFLEYKDNIRNKLQDRKLSASLLRVFNPPRLRERVAEKTIFHSTAYRFKKEKNIKNIITIHDFTHQYFMRGHHKILNTFLKKRAIKNCDGIVCISSNTHDDLMKFFPKLKNKKTVIINNGADYSTFFHIPECVLSKKYSVLNDKKYLLFVGERSGYKNFNYIVDVLKNSDYDLCLVGGKQFTLDESELTKSVSDRIHHFYNVEDNELNILYNCCFAFIYPSLYEGFGIPILEAMNCECPVIAFNNSSIPEVMNGAGILLENNDLNKCLSYLKKLEDFSFRGDLISKQKLACKKFSWDKAYKEMENFYKQVIDNV